jgi:NADH:ubiquinone oxidoreductase subunit E
MSLGYLAPLAPALKGLRLLSYHHFHGENIHSFIMAVCLRSPCVQKADQTAEVALAEDYGWEGGNSDARKGLFKWCLEGSCGSPPSMFSCDAYFTAESITL